ncbi:hypothetical protein FM106_05780 [Brachybacterium faecium]|nr:hypothetical protein FM106_05780 [Brachybacterium faecium]
MLGLTFGVLGSVDCLAFGCLVLGCLPLDCLVVIMFAPFIRLLRV